MAKQRVTFIIDEELYTKYKIALLQRFPRQNVTQNLIAHIREVIHETNKLNGKEE